MGACRVIGRANDDLHARILTLVGAHVTINPERDFGERFANQLVHENIRGKWLSVRESESLNSRPPPRSSARPWASCSCPAVRRHRRGGPERGVRIGFAARRLHALAPDDVLVVVSGEGAVSQCWSGRKSMRLRTELLLYTSCSLRSTSCWLLAPSAFCSHGSGHRTNSGRERFVDRRGRTDPGRVRNRPSAPEAQKRISQELTAQANVTEPEEIPLLNQIKANLPVYV